MSEPFSDDQLGRKAIAQHFKNILLNTKWNVFSLVAPWGCGKTYFIQNLIKTMEEDSINILYNAWESDFYDSPLIPLLSELFVKLESLENDDKLNNDINWSKKFAKKICKGTTVQAGINLKLFNCGLNFDPDKKMLDSDYIELKSEIQEFKCKLKNIQETLNKKIIIFIDELDRCNPMYTIKTLEVIKHFFGIPNIVFVLAVDKSQIENSVRTIFGVNQGAENGYLRKFIDVEFELPKYSSKEFISVNLIKVLDKITKFQQNNRYYRYKGQNNPPSEAIWLADFIFIMANMFDFSLRDIEKFFIRFDLFLDVLSEKDVLLIEPAIVLNTLAMRSMKDFDNYVNMSTESSDLIKELDKTILPLWKGFLFNNYRKTLERQVNSTTTISTDTIYDNMLGLRNILYEKISNNINDQERYLNDYPFKIKFIHNFDIIN